MITDKNSHAAALIMHKLVKIWIKQSSNKNIKGDLCGDKKKTVQSKISNYTVQND